MRFLSYGLRPDTGGAGEYRGGCGIERSWMLTVSRATLSILAERTKVKPWGLQGGEPGALGEYILVKWNGDIFKLPSKCTVQMEKGDSLIIHTPGGGGFGDLKKRDPEKVKRDVANGLVSVEAALRIYGIKTLD